ncbi:beta-1,3-glucan-binding protein-like isoform X5 [Ischnura elegans]|uniref:beta-1,3-glucan-binding protein-like isoform X5 n=1 Tax=Ischnura elegans TaxID=197161 RepID=UPI001ED8ACA9|nr:beta-1,3-glucan-binding protein-like isoform X5 [Ischnura elegans]
MAAAKSAFLVVALSFVLFGPSNAQDSEYIPPPLVLRAYSPVGLRAALPDTPGVHGFEFHASINTELSGTQIETINKDIKTKRKLGDGKDYWIYLDSSTSLKVGDQVHYWYSVEYKGLRKWSPDNVWTVPQLFDPDTNRPIPNSGVRPTSPPGTPAGGGTNTGGGGAGGGVTPAPPANCPRSVTTVNGTPACKGRLIFEENFKEFDLRKWQHEITLSGGRNWEFQLYDNNRTNSYVRNNMLVIKPTLTADRLGNDYFLFARELSLQSGEPGEKCTNHYNHGCYKRAFGASILNPVQSARIRTHNSFSFKYGKVEIRAKMPTGDWIHTGIWLAPRYNHYGPWPASGIIVLAEGRGNGHLMSADNRRIGANSRVDLGLQFAPFQMPSGRLSTTPLLAGRFATVQPTPDEPGYAADFHNYQMEWTPDYIKFSVDDRELGRVTPNVKSGGLWNFANFQTRVPGVENPWRYGTKLAPFDQEFYISIGVAVGGIAYFPDDAVNQPAKPWNNNSPNPSFDFWSQKNVWHRTWRSQSNNGESAALQVDYVRVWAL